MEFSGSGHAADLERSCAIVAAVFSGGRCKRVRVISGEQRAFGMNASRTEMHIPYPAIISGWTLRTWTCAIALQCSPSKQRIAAFSLHALTPKQSGALALVEGGVALGWIARHWPGLLAELRRFLPDLDMLDADLSGTAMLERAMQLARSTHVSNIHPLLGKLPIGLASKEGILAALQRAQSRLPWSLNKRYLAHGYESIPAGGDSDIKTSRLPSASRPEDDDIEIRADRRAGIPYPEWNMWDEAYLPDHVAVLERRAPLLKKNAKPADAKLRRWFEARTHRAMKNRLEDGSDIDIDRYLDYYVDRASGMPCEARVFRDLLPAFRDVATALLLDGSASLSVGAGAIFKLELACADGLCHAMAIARERHGLFVFSGKTRHRVNITCLRDFDDRHSVTPGELGIKTGGYTRLGAPLRHMTSRLLQQRSERRLLIIIGDGLISDEGYEGRYAWADAAHAVEEAEEAGVSLFYIGVGETDVDPLPYVFGARRSTRIRHVNELPRVLARVHQDLIN